MIYSMAHFGVITARVMARQQPSLKIETANPGILPQSFYILESDIFTIGKLDLDISQEKIHQLIPNAANAPEKVMLKNLPIKPSKELLYRYRPYNP